MSGVVPDSRPHSEVEARLGEERAGEENSRAEVVGNPAFVHPARDQHLNPTSDPVHQPYSVLGAGVSKV